MPGKDWDALMREMSSPESSDAEDCLNVVQVTKNAKRVAEILNHVAPGGDRTRTGALPMGTNGLDFMRSSLEQSAAALRQREECRSERAGRPEPKDEARETRGRKARRRKAEADCGGKGEEER